MKKKVKLISYFEVLTSELWSFNVPSGIINDVISWADEILDTEIAFWKDSYLHKSYVISIKQQEDAILFKVTWPECTYIPRHYPSSDFKIISVSSG